MYKEKPLKYKYDALEPYINESIIYNHYHKHYLSYLKKLNDLLTSLNYDYNQTIPEMIKNIDQFPLDKRDDILFLAGGVINHELYFDNMGTQNNPKGAILEKINNDFGNYENFKTQFIKAASVLVGSGYTFLILNNNNKLDIINTSNQDSPLFYNLKPILALDLWEHAYYLQYLNRKDLYIDAFFHIIDFDSLNRTYEQTQEK